MNEINMNEMTETTTEELQQIDGGFNWCAAFVIGGAAAFAGGLTGGAGIWAGAEVGAVASALIC